MLRFSFYFILFLFFASLVSLMSSCGVRDSRGGASYASEIPGPGGVRCFVIYDNGNAVGGNCR
jgi:hypothetical protein